MLIINNGTPKSGSTWINKIVRKTLPLDRLERKWRRKDWNSDSVHPDQLRQFIEHGDWKVEDILIKSHMSYLSKFDYLLQPGIKIIVTYRNLPDSIVSLFHHQMRLKKTPHTKIDIWFRMTGLKFAKKFIAYRRHWAQHESVLMISYESLIEDAPSQISKIGEFLGQNLTKEKANEIAKATQVKLKPDEKPKDGSHTRTGGHSRAHLELPPKILERLIRMEQRVTKQVAQAAKTRSIESKAPLKSNKTQKPKPKPKTKTEAKRESTKS